MAKNGSHGSHTGPPRLEVVPSSDPLDPEEFDADREVTPPIPMKGVSEAAIMRAIGRLEKTVESLSFAVGGLQRLIGWCAFGAAFAFVVGLFLVWLR